MPMHDWTRVSAGTYHDFHCAWLAELRLRLNEGLLPEDHYAQVEQIMEGTTADLLALKESGPEPAEPREVGVAVASAPPRVRFTETLAEDVYASRARRVVIRHSSEDRMVAVLELVSPGNKSAKHPFRTFVRKSLSIIRQGVHLLVIDPFPPTQRDPKGMHGAIWGEMGGKYEPPPDKPLTMASYTAGLVKTAYVEPFAVGDVLTPMPIFLDPEHYVPAPLEESYMRIYRTVARRYRDVLEAGGPAS